MKRLGFFFLSLVFFSGCASTSNVGSIPDRKETEAAIESIAEAISGKELTEEDAKKLKDQIRNDPEAQSAIQAITNSVSGQQRFKYSPVTGKRYAPHMEIDPETGVKLEWVE